jgi:hypothetical protein
MTKGCWYHLLITCIVARYELVCLENLTQEGGQLTVHQVLSTGIDVTIMVYCCNLSDVHNM